MNKNIFYIALLQLIAFTIHAEVEAESGRSERKEVVRVIAPAAAASTTYGEATSIIVIGEPDGSAQDTVVMAADGQAGTSQQGGSTVIISGNGSGTASGGDQTFKAGNGGANGGDGGATTITGGDGSASTRSIVQSDLEITRACSSGSGSGGPVSLSGGLGGTPNGCGGDATVKGGDAYAPGSGDGGQVVIESGQGGATGRGGDVIIAASGAVSLRSGTTSDATGTVAGDIGLHAIGKIRFEAAEADFSNVTTVTGISTSAVIGTPNASVYSNTGNVTIKSGIATDATGTAAGDISLHANSDILAQVETGFVSLRSGATPSPSSLIVAGDVGLLAYNSILASADNGLITLRCATSSDADGSSVGDIGLHALNDIRAQTDTGFVSLRSRTASDVGGLIVGGIGLHAKKDVLAQANEGYVTLRSVTTSDATDTSNGDISLHANSDILAQADTGFVSLRSGTTLNATGTVAGDIGLRAKATTGKIRFEAAEADFSNVGTITGLSTTAIIGSPDALISSATGKISIKTGTNDVNNIGTGTGYTLINGDIGLRATSDIGVQADGGRVDIRSGSSVNLDSVQYPGINSVGVLAKDNLFQYAADGYVSIGAGTVPSGLVSNDIGISALGHIKLTGGDNKNITVTTGLTSGNINLQSTAEDINATANFDINLQSTAGNINAQSTAGRIDIHAGASSATGISTSDIGLRATSDILAQADAGFVSLRSGTTSDATGTVAGDIGLRAKATTGKIRFEAAEADFSNVGIVTGLPVSAIIGNPNASVSSATGEISIKTGVSSLGNIDISTHSSGVGVAGLPNRNIGLRAENDILLSASNINFIEVTQIPSQPVTVNFGDAIHNVTVDFTHATVTGLSAGAPTTVDGGDGNPGGVATVQGGDGNVAAAAGGAAIVRGGDGLTTGNGGDVTIKGGGSPAGNGGDLYIWGGIASDSGGNNSGGTVEIEARPSNGTAGGGSVNITAGPGGLAGNGGAILLSAGNGGINGGGTAGSGGNIELIPGLGAGSDPDGDIRITYNRTTGSVMKLTAMLFTYMKGLLVGYQGSVINTSGNTYNGSAGNSSLVAFGTTGVSTTTNFSGANSLTLTYNPVTRTIDISGAAVTTTGSLILGDVDDSGSLTLTTSQANSATFKWNADGTITVTIS
ncbi:MAG: hypothetical protein WC747_03405 [Candidatus Babeliales bacterium]|jgi:hypothetical protein